MISLGHDAFLGVLLIHLTTEKEPIFLDEVTNLEKSLKVIQPNVNPAHEFLEIVYDFSNSLDLVHEGIHHAFDAKAKMIQFFFSVVSDREKETKNDDLE
ncbi:hypothetical protein MO973_25300 [Paenibacillus sp. TRM 82003]|nr:hypothetical protein [Paenibacillus sp. TRM 82003]